MPEAVQRTVLSLTIVLHASLWTSGCQRNGMEPPTPSSARGATPGKAMEDSHIALAPDVAQLREAFNAASDRAN